MNANKFSKRYLGRVGRKVLVGITVVLFILAGCQWAPNQSGSEMTIQIAHGSIGTQSSDTDSETTRITQALNLRSGITSMEALAESEITALETATEFDDLEFDFFDFEFDRESGLMLYYIEEEYLISQGNIAIDAQGLLDEFFEKNYGDDLFNVFDETFDDEEYLEQIETQLIKLVEEYEKEYSDFTAQFGEPPYEDEEVEEAFIELQFNFFVAFFEILFQPLVALFEFINDLYTSGITLQDRFPNGAGGFAANIRGGSSYQGPDSSTSFTFQDLRGGATYVVIAAYFETQFEYEDEDGEPVPEINYEMFGIGRVTLEEGAVRSVRIPLTTSEETEAQLNDWYPEVTFDFNRAFDLFGDF